MQHPPDQSWCARINAHRAAPPIDASASVSRAGETARSGAADAPERDAAQGDAGRAETLPHGSPYRLREVPSTHTCECCGTVMYDSHCKIVCPNCGYKRDCSDP